MHTSHIHHPVTHSCLRLVVTNIEHRWDWQELSLPSWLSTHVHQEWVTGKRRHCEWSVPLSWDIPHAWFHLASCQFYNIWDSHTTVSSRKERLREVMPLAQDTQPADGTTRIHIQKALWPCLSSCLNVCIWDHRGAEMLPKRNSPFLPSPLSSVCLFLPVFSSPSPPYSGQN